MDSEIEKESSQVSVSASTSQKVRLKVFDFGIISSLDTHKVARDIWIISVMSAKKIREKYLFRENWSIIKCEKKLFLIFRGDFSSTPPPASPKQDLRLWSLLRIVNSTMTFFRHIFHKYRKIFYQNNMDKLLIVLNKFFLEGYPPFPFIGNFLHHS